jgi:acid phosphatase
MLLRFTPTLLLAITLTAAAQPAPPTPTPDSLAQVNGVLWTQQAVEHQAVSLAMYRAASAALVAAAKGPAKSYIKAGAWATLETGPASTGRKAVVMDLDETVLDNAAYSAWLAKANQHYVEPTWQDWMALRQAKAIPGALEFVRLAAKLKVDVFFITNRECVPKDADPCPALEHTRRNLLALGFERAARPEAFMLKKQRPEWDSSDKTSRRQWVAQTHQIVMLVGDDMGDFLPVAKVAALRAGTPDAETDQAMTLLGKRWFVIPNPMYGSWEKAVPRDALGRLGALQAPEGWGAP